MVGAEICGEVVFEVNLSLQNEYTWKEHGFELTVPEGALPPGMTVTVAVRAIVGGSFELPQSSELIGAFYWITSTHTFQKKVTVRLQHCAIIESNEECENFKFLIGECPQLQLPYKFTVVDGNFTPHSQFASVSLSEFSIITVVYNWTLGWFLGPLPPNELPPDPLTPPDPLMLPDALLPPPDADALPPLPDPPPPPPEPLPPHPPPSKPKRMYTAQLWYKKQNLTNYHVNIAVIITQHVPTYLEVS